MRTLGKFSEGDGLMPPLAPSLSSYAGCRHYTFRRCSRLTISMRWKTAFSAWLGRKKKNPFGKYHSASVPILDHVLLDFFVSKINTLLFVSSAISQVLRYLQANICLMDITSLGAGEEQIITEFILSSMLLLE